MPWVGVLGLFCSWENEAVSVPWTNTSSSKWLGGIWLWSGPSEPADHADHEAWPSVVSLRRLRGYSQERRRAVQRPHGVPPEHLDLADAQEWQALKVPEMTRWRGPRSSEAWWLFPWRSRVSDREKDLPQTTQGYVGRIVFSSDIPAKGPARS